MKKSAVCADTAAIPESPWTDAEGKVKLQGVGGAAGSMHENKTGRLTRREAVKSMQAGTRTGTTTKKATIKQKKKYPQKQIGEAHCEDYLLENVFNFDYLGSVRLPSRRRSQARNTSENGTSKIGVW